jgi:ribulose-5-phosphate 4-epimerase/fuculose-1-phosphate aldolase
VTAPLSNSIRRDIVLSEAERQARTDLAAAYRLAAAKGWVSSITNHFTLRVPCEPDMFLVKPHDLLFEEVTASSLLKLAIDGRPLDASSNVNPAGFAIHTGVLQARPDINCVLHVHTDAGMAMSAHKRGLRPLNQGAMRFFNRLSYHEYEGPSGHLEERERLARSLGANYAMILRNHGLLSSGPTVLAAFRLLGALITACRVQLMLEATGAEIAVPDDEECEKLAQRIIAVDTDPEVTGPEWPAELRRLERLQGAGYRD